jgi:hypothetical protein
MWSGAIRIWEFGKLGIWMDHADSTSTRRRQDFNLLVKNKIFHSENAKWNASFIQRQGNVIIYNLRYFDFAYIQVEELERFNAIHISY